MAIRQGTPFHKIVMQFVGRKLRYYRIDINLLILNQEFKGITAPISALCTRGLAGL